MRHCNFRRYFVQRLGCERLERRDALSTVVGGDIVTTTGQVVPDFGASPTDYSVASGAWSNSAIWSAGRVPAAGDVVDVDTRVEYDANTSTAIKTLSVQPGGELAFSTSTNTRLVVGNLVVMEGGTLTIGAPSNPVTAHAEVDFAGTLGANDPQQWGVGLIGLGTVTVYGAPLSNTWLPLATEPKTGDTTITLSSPVAGWQPGNTLLIPDSRELNGQQASNYIWQGDTPTIKGVNGTTVTLMAPLRYSHPGARDANGVLDFTPDVADMSRNIVFATLQTGGSRPPLAPAGHLTFLDRAAVDVAYAEFDGLGRTTTALFGPTNIADRDAIDLDNLMGPVGLPAGTPQFTLDGDVVNGSPKVDIGLQNAAYGMLTGNVVFNAAGAGIFLEDGGEVHNTIQGNLTCLDVGDNRAVYQDNNADDFGHEGVGFWERSQDNSLIGNVATDALNSDFTISQEATFARPFVTAQPSFPGANLADLKQSPLVDVNTEPMLEFAGNMAYGGDTSLAGLYIWQAGMTVTQVPVLEIPEVGMSTIEGFTAWNLHVPGIDIRWADNYCIDGYVYRGGGFPSSGIGYRGTDRIARNIEFGNPDIQGASIGIVVPTMEDIQTDRAGAGQARPFAVEGGRIAALVGIEIQPPFDENGVTGDIANYPPLNVTIDSTNFTGSKTAIDMLWATAGMRNFIVPETIAVADFNGVVGDDFRVYYIQQAASFVLPQSTYRNGAIFDFGSPVASLTNALAWNKYGIAVAGAMAPSTAHTRNGIVGLIA
jgi:hypothetical protein